MEDFTFREVYQAVSTGQWTLQQFREWMVETCSEVDETAYWNDYHAAKDAFEHE